MVFVLTTEGYINVLNPALRLHKFKAISGCEEANPHISIDLYDEDNLFEITFLNGVDVVLSDSILLLNSDGEYKEIDKLKFGTKLAFVRTPDSIVERLLKKPEYIAILNDLAKLIIEKGKLRKVDYDAIYCDMLVEWNKEKLNEFVFSLSSIGVYIKIKINMTKSNSFVLTADSNSLNYIEQYKNIITPDNIKLLENMKAIGETNIDKYRDIDDYKIVKKVAKTNISQLFLKAKSGVDNWEYITIFGLQCKSSKFKNKEIL